MYDQILFPTDGSEVATTALEYACEVAVSHDATLHILNVVDSTLNSASDSREELTEERRRAGEQIVEDATIQARSQGLSVTTDVVRGIPHDGIITYCQRHEIGLIVMPTYGRSDLGGFLLGSVTERVINRSPIPVLTVTPEEIDEFVYPPSHVLVPTDGSDGSNRALDEAIVISNAFGASVHLLHVIETAALGIEIHSKETRDELETHAEEVLSTATKIARDSAVNDVTGTFRYGHPYKEIRSYIKEEEIDLVTLGTHGKTNFSHHHMGSVSPKLLRTSPVPVMVSRTPSTE